MESANQLVMEPQPKIGAIQESESASVKSILFVVHDDNGLMGRLQTALSLARSCSAHLQLLQIIPLDDPRLVRSEYPEPIQEQGGTDLAPPDRR